MDSGLDTIPLGQLVAAGESITYGVVKPGDNPPDGVRFIRGGDIKAGRVDTSGLRHISSEVSKQYKRTLLRGGELLVSLVGNPGEVAIASPDLAGANIARQVGLVRLAPSSSAEFIKYYLMSPPGKLALGAQSLGSVQSVINLSDLKRVPVPQLPLSTQQAIAAILSGLDHKIELNWRMNETLEAMAQAIFRDWFVDFGPVRRKLAGETDPVIIMGGLTPDSIRAAELATLFPAALAEDGLPEGWMDCPIGDQVEIAGGSTPSTADESLWNPAEHRWATPKDLSNMSDLALFETGRRISSAGLAKITSGLLPAGTVLLSSRAPIGYLAIAQEPVAINQGFIALKTTADHGSAYLYLWCKANMEAILANANGSTFQEISKKNFRPITSAVPSDPAILRAFGEIAQPVIDRIVSAARENCTLAKTRDYLLPRLMSGEVRVASTEVVA
jgi:type I restriction enzyme, S subunit